MKRSLLILSLLIFAASSALAERTITLDFDTQDPPLFLGSYGAEYIVDLDPTMNYGGGTGNALRIVKGPGGTLQIYIAGVWGLLDNDMVTASFDRFDDTANGAQSPGSPAGRVWGHYNESFPEDLLGFNGSASGNFDYGLGEGWDRTEWTWTVFPGHTGLMIECRVYDFPGDTVWIDNLSVTVPDHAYVQTPHGIYLPDGGIVATEIGSWGKVKALYR